MKQFSRTQIRIYPNQDQAKKLDQTFGCARFVYNYYLDKKTRHYLETGKNFNYYDCANDIVFLKKQEEYQWIKDVNAQSLQSVLQHLETAFLRFFRKTSDYPKFKKRYGKQTFEVQQHFKFVDKNILLPKVGLIKFKGKIPDGIEKYRSLTVSKSKTGKYFVSILTERDIHEKETVESKIGLDLGLTHLAIDSNGKKYRNLKQKRKYKKKLAYLSRQLSKKQKGSNNKNKARIKLAIQYEKQTNIKKDYYHKLTTKLINENQVICLEDLKIKNMIKNHNLAGSIQDVSWYMLTSMLEYKGKWYGRDVVKINTFFPSSKICSSCGCIKESLSLNIRSWKCQECDEVHDRDINAAKNILKQGLNILKLSGSGTESDVKQKPGEASARSRRIRSSKTKVESMKREAECSLDVQ